MMELKGREVMCEYYYLHILSWLNIGASQSTTLTLKSL